MVYGFSSASLLAMLTVAVDSPAELGSKSIDILVNAPGGRLVGPVSTEDRVAIVDDTITTGSAFVEAAEALVEAGITIVQAISVVDRSGGRVHELLAERGIPFVALVEPSDLGVDDT